MTNNIIPEWGRYIHSILLTGLFSVLIGSHIFAQSTSSTFALKGINIIHASANEPVNNFAITNFDGLLFVQKKYWHDFYISMHTNKILAVKPLDISTISTKKNELILSAIKSNDNVKKFDFLKNASFKILGGTRGLPGLELNLWVSPRINIAVGYGHLTYTIEEFESNFGISAYYATIDAQVNLSNINILAEYKPRGGAFRMVAGLAWFPKNKISGIGTLRDGFQFNDILFTPEELGAVGANIEYKWKINPYAGIGFGRSHPKGRFGFTFDIGVFYKGKPQLEIVATSLARHNILNQEKLQKIADDYQWWPVIDLGIKYRIF